jgi:hypothetical protein
MISRESIMLEQNNVRKVKEVSIPKKTSKMHEKVVLKSGSDALIEAASRSVERRND